jgi:hypothetical protein
MGTMKKNISKLQLVQEYLKKIRKQLKKKQQ